MAVGDKNFQIPSWEQFTSLFSGGASGGNSGLDFSLNSGDLAQPSGIFGGLGNIAGSGSSGGDAPSLGNYGSDGAVPFGLNVGTGKTLFSGLSSIGNLWGAMQSQKLAKDQFKFTKDVTNTNLANQIQSYNTALTDRITSRGVAQGMSDAQVQDYLNKNRMSRA